MYGVKAFTGAAAAVLLMAYTGPMPALADTIEAALVRAYQNNPQLNAQRASVRATDENVPQALSGYRPKVTVTAGAPVAAIPHRTTARARIEAENAKPVIVETMRSAGTQPASHTSASTAKTTPGVSTTNTSRVCE